MASNSSKKRMDKPNYAKNGDKRRRNSDRGRTANKDSDAKFRSREDCGSLNDLSWYNRYPELLAAAGAIPYPYRPGMTMPTAGQFDTTVPGGGSISLKGTTIIPGVLAIDWLPSVGIANDVTDPASVVCKEMYARVRANFSGDLSVDAPDFLMYVMALDSVFAFIAHAKRIYRCVSLYTPQNYVFPDVMLHALGCNSAFITDAVANKTKFWGQINELVYQSRKFTCPATMDIFNRHYWMSDNIYADSPEANAQFYAFRMAGLFKFEELPLANDPNTRASGLHCVKLPVFNSVDEMFAFARGLIDALVAWDEAYTINGYLLKAYQDTPSFVVQTLQQDEVLVPVYVPEVLSQIENCTPPDFMTGFSLQTNYGQFYNPNAASTAELTTDIFSGMNVTQNVITNSVVANPRFMVAASASSEQITAAGRYNNLPMMSIRSIVPTVADSVIASRMKAHVGNATYRTFQQRNVVEMAVIGGTEIPMMFVMYLRPDDAGSMNVASRMMRVNTPDIDYDTTETVDGGILAITQFDWHPLIRYDEIDTKTPGFEYYRTQFIGDVHNLTQLSLETLKQLHKVCIYSEFNAFYA